ncbi:hypothetical protein INS49_005456 [Diaporthe citri]|uniref:uncharacterized protein n=1 Tax=Diaporthe citri TaxID=83186 RepID=UPI001C815FDA|nr:uncharacterized protein INS49_005456 [Diaporthe citri]KAG6353747.1 hypothetical protein INS49_005456 [Diaporthe citri]
MGTIDVILQGAKYAALIFIPHCFLIASYRVFFHPLSKYPGPLAAKLSDAYAGFYATFMRLHLATTRDLENFGPVIRHGPNKLIFNSAEALQDLYNNERVTKSWVYLLTPAAENPSIFNTLDRRQHSIKRRLIGQAINDKAMRDFEPTMMGQIDVFIGIIREASKTFTPVDMTDGLKRLGVDSIVGLLAFGFPLNLQTDPTYRFMIEGLSFGGYRVHCHMQFPLIKRLGIQYLLFIAGWFQRAKYGRMMHRMIRTRLSEDKHARHDLYSVLADHLDNSTADGMTTSQLWSEALFFFPAGPQAGKPLLPRCLHCSFYLSRNPEIYEKLAKEVRSTFSSDVDIRGGSKLAGCRYLRACIDEALRMSPPVPGTPWRELYLNERDRPLIIDGHVVPPGTQVGVCFYSLHHNEKYFADPFTYRPERWLVDDELAVEAISASTKVYAYTVNITNLTAVDTALDAFARHCASRMIDILVANAGSLGPLSSIRDANPLEWWDGFEIDIKGNFNLVHAFLQKANETSAIIHLSSGVVHGPYFPNESSYCASKAGAVKLFEYVHHENPDMFVLCLQPGLVAETGMSPGFENIAKGIQMDMASLPWDDVELPGDFVVWAVSPEARFLNGRFVWANWDVDELKDDRDAILANPQKFTLGLVGS